jgi:glycosidase
MSGPWPAHPVIYELSTLPWLNEIAARSGRPVTLDSVPAAEWDGVALPGVDAVWLMGVWERSPAGRAIAQHDRALRQELYELLPDATDADIVGSPYCVRSYRVDLLFGGPEALSVARAELAARGVRVLLDFVPNHVAPDHDWVTAHPDYFVRGTEADLGVEPPAFMKTDAGVIALGRDPYFPPWPDVVQLDPTRPSLRAAVIETLSDIASQCDGVRCDMAMLQLDDVVAQTWGDRVGPTGAVPYWTEVTRAVQTLHPNFLFVAESYWDREPDLIAQGFDHCYDKRLYDRLVSDSAGSVRDHLAADPEYQRRLVRFLENHDEPRAAAVFPADRGEAAAVVVATLPGALLLFQGQFAGRRHHMPVQLARWPAEPPSAVQEALWRRLLDLSVGEGLRSGRWSVLGVSGWPDNDSCRNLLAWQWEGEHHRHLIVVNFSGTSADGLVHVEGTTGSDWDLTDVLDGQSYQRAGADMDPATGGGLYVSRGPFEAHLFRLIRIADADVAASSSDLE